MSDVIATLRVISDAMPGSRPSANRVAAAAAALRSVGFEVLHAGRFGVSVRAGANAYETSLGVHVDNGEEARVETLKPTDPMLSKLVDLLEITPRAQVF
jgi:hypothetical protein